jgi:hypothetical protein
MGLIREPLDVDFEVDPRPLTMKEKKAISDFIKADKLKRAKAKARLAKRKSTRPKRRRVVIKAK